MSYVSEVLADSPRHFWSCASAPSMLVQDTGAVPACFIYNGSYNNGGFSGLDLGGWAYYVSANNQLQSGIALPFTSPSTFEIWFWLPFVPSALYELYAWDGLGAGSLNIYIDAGNKLNCGGPGGTVTDTVNITARTWHHVVFAYDAVSGIGYKDGAAFGVAVAGSGAGFTGGVTLGARNGAGGMTGLISAAAHYPAKLAAARVLAHYNAASLKALTPVFIAQGSVNYVTLTEAPTGGLSDAILASVRKTY